MAILTHHYNGSLFGEAAREVLMMLILTCIVFLLH